MRVRMVCLAVGFLAGSLLNHQAALAQESGGPAAATAEAVARAEAVGAATGAAEIKPILTPTPTETSTSTFTPTPTFTVTDTFTPTETFTSTPSFTPTSTFTPTPTFTPTATFTPTPLGAVHFLDRLIDLDRLALLEEGVSCKQFSSYDRKSRYDAEKNEYIDWDANGDAGKYLRVEPDTGEAVMAEIEGPGCIWRIWSANPQGKVRFYFDGAQTPSCEFEFNDLFDANKSPFPRPLVWQRRVDLGGDNPASNCYMPIPFAKSCKVTADKPHNQYYHIGYSTFPPETRVTTFHPERSQDEESALARVTNALLTPGADPQPVEGLQFVEKAENLPAGQSLTLAEIQGPATIRQLFAKLASPERYARRKVLLQIFWDGAEKPSVEAPIGDFFGDAWDEAEYASLAMGIGPDLNYCFWRMPFQKSARIVATNQGEHAAELKWKIGYLSGPLPEGSAYFHAKWRRDQASRDFDYPVLECTGKGRYLGMVLFPDNLAGGWWGEGDEKVYVDGEKFPSTFGTGSEDYFGDAWGIRAFANPYHGCVTGADWSAARRQSVYRWHVTDNIPFTQSFRITMENYSAKSDAARKNDYSSMAYWYQAPGGADCFETTEVAARIPQGPIVPDAVDAEAVLAREELPAGVEIVSDSLLPKEAMNHTAVRIEGAPGTTITLKVPVQEYDKYTLAPIVLDSRNNSRLVFHQAGKAIGEWVRLSPGENRIQATLEPDGKVNAPLVLVLDGVVVQSYRNLVTDWIVAAPFAGGIEDQQGPEGAEALLGATFEGRDGPVTWRRIKAEDGVVRMESLCGPGEGVLSSSCAVFSPDDRSAVALFASNVPAKVWINGEPVHHVEKPRGMKLDSDRFEVRLRRGWNQVMVKVAQAKGAGSFAFRIKDPDEELFFRAHRPGARAEMVEAPASNPAPPGPCDCNLVEVIQSTVETVLGCLCPAPCCP